MPRLVPEIEILPWRRTQVLAVQVYPSPSRPHYLKREGLGERRLRSGRLHQPPRRPRADRGARRFARGEAFDEQPMPELDSEALDFRAASESFAPVRKLAARTSRPSASLTTHQGRKVPTVGGMLLFGRDRERHFPDAWIQAGRFQGTDKSRIIDRAEIRSYPVRGHRGGDRLRPQARPPWRRDRRRAPHGALEPPARCGARGDHQRGGPCRLCAARRAHPGVDLRRPARGREPGAPALRPHDRGSATRGLEAAQPRDRPGLPRAGPDRAVGQRHPAHDRGLPRGRGSHRRSSRRSATRFRVTLPAPPCPAAWTADRAILDDTAREGSLAARSCNAEYGSLPAHRTRRRACLHAPRAWIPPAPRIRKRPVTSSPLVTLQLRAPAA